MKAPHLELAKLISKLREDNIKVSTMKKKVGMVHHERLSEIVKISLITSRFSK